MGVGAKKTAYLGLFTGLALIFSYVETLIPFNFGIPGVKIGLANIVTLTVLYIWGVKESFAVLICRIILSGLLFGNMYGIIYSLAGGLFALGAMWIVKKCGRFDMISVSIAGGVMHNMGQLLIAIVTVTEIRVMMYGPVLIISGLVTGLFLGMICKIIIKTIETYVRI